MPVVALNQDAAATSTYHHTMDDTLDKVRPDELAQNVAAWASFIYLVADSDIDFRALSARGPGRSGRALISPFSQREGGTHRLRWEGEGSEPAGAPVGAFMQGG